MSVHTFEWIESRTIDAAQEAFRVRAYGTDTGWVVFERREAEIWWTEVPMTDAVLEKIRQLQSGDSDTSP